MRRKAQLLVVVVLLAGTASAALASGSPVKARFTNYGFSVRYPSSLTRTNWCWTGMHVFPIAVLTDAAPPVCDPNANPMTWPPAQPLGAGQMSVFFSLVAPPGVRANLGGHWNARIGGRRARVSRPAYGDTYDLAVTCPAGAQREFRDAGILRPHTSKELIEVLAVMCGPNLASADATFGRVLHSIRFTR